MTITTNDARDEYTSGPGQTVFNYTFKIFASDELDVYVTPAGQEANDSTDLTTDYIVDSGTIGNEAGGFITFNTPLSAGDKVTIASGIPYDRTTDYQFNGDFNPTTVNNDNDRQTAQIKQVLELARKAVVFGQAQQSTSGLTSEAPQAGRFIRWKQDLSGFENVDLTDLGSVVPISSIDVVYPTVALMKADSLGVLSPGVTVSTQGYYSAGDGGGAEYLIASPQSVDEFGDHTLSSGNVALIQGNGAINVKQYGATGDGATDDKAAIQAAITKASGNEIFLPAGTFKSTSPYAGTQDIFISGEGTLSNTDSDMFEHTGGLHLKFINVVATGRTVFLGSTSLAGSGVHDFTLDGVIFNGAERIFRIEEGGVSPFTYGIDNLKIVDCRFDSVMHNAFELGCLVGDADIQGNSWTNQGGHCFFTKTADVSQNPGIKNTRLIGNSVEGVDQGNSGAARGFYATGESVTITGNTFTDIASTNASFETAAIYTKSKFVAVTANTFKDIKGAHPTNNFCIDIKGTHVPSADTGTNIVVSDNVMHNEQSDNQYTIGVRAYGDRMLITNNQMNGLAQMIDTDGSSASEGSYLTGNKGTNPAVIGNNFAIDLRVDGGKWYVKDNVADGYDDGVRIKPTNNDVDLVVCEDNDFLCTAGYPYFVSRAAGVPNVNELRIVAGRSEGLYLYRSEDDCTPNVFIDADVSGITNKALFNMADKHARTFTAKLRNHIISGNGAGSTNALLLPPVDNCTAHLDMKAVMREDGGTYSSSFKRAAYQNTSGTLSIFANVTEYADGTGLGITLGTSGASMRAFVSGTVGQNWEFNADMEVRVACQ